jgi:hypothetical protein
MESLCCELKTEIFRYVSTPISLILINRNWYFTSQDSHARAEWIIYKYGRAHALFHAIRLGNNFVTVEVVQVLLAKKAIMSRYFIQRLMMQYGTYDPKLIEMKNKYNINIDVPKNKPWASDLSLPVFTKLIAEANNELKTDIAVRGNDLELFHYLTAGTHAINRAPPILSENLQEIEDLILNKKFIPFPSRPRLITLHKTPPVEVSEHFPSQDGYENNRQINLISRAILIHPELVTLWKKIGYTEVCSDMNGLVMKGSFLVCFPPNPPNTWVCPSSDAVAEKLQKLINLGFQLTDKIIEELIKMFESRIQTVGEPLLNSFYKIRGNSTPVIVETTLTEIRKVDKKKGRRRQKL